MLRGRHKRITAGAQSRQLRRRLYRWAAIVTIVYVALSVINFLFQLPALPYELAIIWAVVVLCYAMFREALRWNNVDDTNYPGEFLAGLVVVGGIFMIIWNIGRGWLFHLPRIVFPQDYEAAVIETIVLYTLSGASSFIYKQRRTPGKLRHKTHVKMVQEEQELIAVPKISPAADSLPGSEAKTILTSAPKAGGKKEEEHIN